MALRFLTTYAMVRDRSAFERVISMKGVYDLVRHSRAETRLGELLKIALTCYQWAENEHFQALSIALGMPIYVFCVFKGSQLLVLLSHSSLPRMLQV